MHATLAFPRPDADLETAVRIAVEAGVTEVGCWALGSDERLGSRLIGLGFQEGWAAALDGDRARESLASASSAPSRRADECSAALPYGHDPAPSDVARHLVVRDGDAIAGHVVLHVEGDTGGVYDMGVAASARRRGYGTALTPRGGLGRARARLREPDAERDRRGRASL